MTQPPEEDRPTHYRLLGLQIRADVSPAQVKAAYKRALLTHHPDKKRVVPHQNAVTVDDIALAYKILSEPNLRKEYDQALLVSNSPAETPTNKLKIFHTGLDTVDLDDLNYDDTSQTWTRSCRCGDTKGFVVTGADLEQSSDDRELITGCKGCSLWLRVLFSVEE